MGKFGFFAVSVIAWEGLYTLFMHVLSPKTLVLKHAKNELLSPLDQGAYNSQVRIYSERFQIKQYCQTMGWMNERLIQIGSQSGVYFVLPLLLLCAFAAFLS